MTENIAEFITKHNLIGKTIIIGFSGGADSMCLLDMMKHIAPEMNIKIVAAHYNHNWRGDESKSEQEKCREYCLINGIEFYTETETRNIKKTETQARELRYGFFERVIEKYNADALFTAHNFDDNAETVLYRIIKGTGINGLKGIPPVRGKYYRPILDMTREEIETYCKKHGLAPNIDLSNEDTKYSRNFIRHEIMPILEKINPCVKKSLNNLSKTAVSEMSIVSEYLSKQFNGIIDGNKIKKQNYLKLSEDMKLEVIRRFLGDFEYNYDMIENIRKFLDNTSMKSTKYSLDKNRFLYTDDNNIEVITVCPENDTVLNIDKTGVYNLGHAVFSIEKCNKREDFKDETVVYADLSNRKNLTLRTRRNGDIIAPLGAGGTVKLKKYLIDKKIPRHKRDKLVFLCCEDEVLWAAGVGISEKIKTITRPTHKLSVEYDEDIL